MRLKRLVGGVQLSDGGTGGQKVVQCAQQRKKKGLKPFLLTSKDLSCTHNLSNAWVTQLLGLMLWVLLQGSIFNVLWRE